MAKLTLDEWIVRLKKNKSFHSNAAAIVEIPAKTGEWEDYPEAGEHYGDQWFICEWNH